MSKKKNNISNSNPTYEVVKNEDYPEQEKESED